VADVTAKDVQRLRQMTGAGMLDCKKALEESGGDIEEAAKQLRLKGLAGAAKRDDREASEGAVAAVRSGDAAAVVELRCSQELHTLLPRVGELRQVDASLFVACVLLTVPLFFSGMVFSGLIGRAGVNVSTALAYNLMGALFGGVMEYNSMYFGFAFLYLLAMGFYFIAFAFSLKSRALLQPAE